MEALIALAIRNVSKSDGTYRSYRDRGFSECKIHVVDT